MSRTRAGFLALAFLGWGSLAHALGLGEIEVRSRLNQPLSAVIPVSSTVPGELDGVTIELASNEEFERVGLERSEFLSSLRFQVQGNTIKVTSKQIAREPFVSFLLDVRWADGRLLREYTVLLDPPALAPSASQRPAEVAKPAPQQPAATPAPTPARPAAPQPQAAEAPAEPQAQPEAESATETETETEAPAAPAPSRASGDTYGPVAPKETLWSIAYQLRPDASLTMDQMQVAIFNANPRAFHDGRLTGLMKGVTLYVPSLDEIRAVDPVAAKAQVAAARNAAGAAPAARAEPAPPQPVTQAAPPAEPETAPAEAPAAEMPAETPPAETPAEAPPVAEEAPATAPAEAPAEAPIETTPAPAAQAPIIEEESGLVAQLRGLAENPLLIPAVAGIVVLLLLLLAGKWARNRYAQWSYQRALRRAPVAGSAAAAEASYEDETPAEPPSTQSMLDEEAPPAHADETQTFSQPPVPQARPPAAPQPIMETMQQTQAHEPALAQSGGKLDFDVTGNFSSETVQINLEAGDPVSEAEFHRAYGLYDEAALLLKQALQKDPKRTDARVKLAEIYFEASRQKEFIDVARELKGQLPAEEWQKIALLGTQIAPDDELFKGGAMDVGGAVDLSFDEPAAPAAAPTPAKAAPAAAAAASDSLDFKFEDIQLPDVPAAPAAPAAPAEGGLEFDLGSLSLETPGSEPSAPAAASAPTMPATGGDELSLDLGDFDLKIDAGTSAPAGGGESAELSLDAPMEDASGAGGDEASTKLDLARAYIDMGDNDMAKSLLTEVAQQGTAEQQKEAQELLKRIPG